MNKIDIVEAIDIHNFLDRLEERCDISSYYKINHLSPEQRNQLAACMADSLTSELKKMGFSTEIDC